jgi:proton-dependent oligopeptide transporter, POT family
LRNYRQELQTMAGSAVSNDYVPPEYPQIMGHPKPLWMLFMSEFWERFAFYGIRWALVLYMVAEFHKGDASGEAPSNLIYGAYLAIVYAVAIFGGYIADRVIGYQRSILIGAVIMAAGLFMIALPNPDVFKLGLATIIVGNGLFKPNISTMVGKLYGPADGRRDSGFTIFYMGINAGAFISPILTDYLARHIFGTPDTPQYQVVFIASGIGMLISLVWFLFGRGQLKGVGSPPAGAESPMRMVWVVLGCLAAIPVVYFLLAIKATTLQYWVLFPMFAILCALLLIEGFKVGSTQRDRVIAMLIIFAFNILFWMFFEQAGSSFTFLADKIVDRVFPNGWEFPVAWFQSVNSLAIIALAPIVAWIWVAMKDKNPSIPRKFGLGLIFNGLAFALLMFALSQLVDDAGKIPFWTLFSVYVIQSIGELCLSPIGLSSRSSRRCASSASAWAAGSCPRASATTCRASSRATSRARKA